MVRSVVLFANLSRIVFLGLSGAVSHFAVAMAVFAVANIFRCIQIDENVYRHASFIVTCLATSVLVVGVFASPPPSGVSASDVSATVVGYATYGGTSVPFTDRRVVGAAVSDKVHVGATWRLSRPCRWGKIVCLSSVPDKRLYVFVIYMILFVSNMGL